MDLSELKKYVGNYSQMFGISEYQLTSGRAKGIKVLDIRNGSGLEVQVLDKAMDLGEIRYKGEMVSFLTPQGFCAPEFASDKEFDFLNTFAGGGFITAGYNNVGAPGADEKGFFGLHGKLHTLTADNFGGRIEWNDDKPDFIVNGRVREAYLFGENIELNRRYVTRYGQKSVYIYDEVKNEGYKDEPISCCFHFNIGYPVVSEDSEIIIPYESYETGNEESATTNAIQKMMRCEKPQDSFVENVYFHKMKADHKGNTVVAVFNKKRKLGVAIHFNINELPRITEWKLMQSGSYVLGLEPSNIHGKGRDSATREGMQPMIKPGEMKTFKLCYEIIDGDNRFNEIKDFVASI